MSGPKCPNCRGPGGVMLLFSVAPCSRCENEKRTKERSGPGLTARALGVRDNMVRYIPFSGVVPDNAFRAGEWPTHPRGYRDRVVRSLNSGEAEKDLADGMGMILSDAESWSWGYRSGHRINFGIIDFGEDRANWREVSENKDWGQPK